MLFFYIPANNLFVKIPGANVDLWKINYKKMRCYWKKWLCENSVYL